MLAGICAIFGAAFLTALLVAVTGRARVAEAIALLLGTVALAAIVAAAGGPASPAAIVLAALPFEAWWTRRTPGQHWPAWLRHWLPCRCRLSWGGYVRRRGNACRGALADPARLSRLRCRRASPRGWTSRETSGGRTSARWKRSSRPSCCAWMRAGEVIRCLASRRAGFSASRRNFSCRRACSTGCMSPTAWPICARWPIFARRQGFRRVEARMRVPGSAGTIAADYRSFVIEMMRPAAGDQRRSRRCCARTTRRRRCAPHSRRRPTPRKAPNLPRAACSPPSATSCARR